MKYSAGIVSFSFWLQETKITAKYMLEGLSRKEIVNLSLNDNIYQVDSERRAKRIANTLFKRLNGFSDEFLEYLINADVKSSKILVLIAILKNDKLFFEFMYEVFREHIILGDYSLKQTDFSLFFVNKAQQSDIVDKWADSTIKRLERNYKLFLTESDLLNSINGENSIIVPFIDSNLNSLLVKNDLSIFIKILTGEN